MAFKDLEDFVDTLWDFDDGGSRKHWEERPYRVLYQRCVHLVEAWCGEEESEVFQEQVKILFVTTNWVVPYPNHTVFWQHTKTHERMWLSVYHPRVAVHVQAGQKVRWRDLTRVVAGREEEWKIGRRRREVLGGVLEEPKEARLDMGRVREVVLQRWAAYQAEESGEDGR